MTTALVVDRKGLARKLAKRPKAFIIYELLQNCWDEDVKVVEVEARMLDGRPVCAISVVDDAPEGFQDLTSVFTLFKDSKKAADATKRGRFEMGEKLVLALALSAEVKSTKGTIVFEGDERRSTRAKTSAGTSFKGEFRMTRAEFDELSEAVHMLAVPKDITTLFNGARLEPREVLHTFETTLQTVRSDGEGNLTATQRKTQVHVYEVRDGETAHVYEMGIPVVETGDKWHYDVQQRVPVNWERNNVPPGFLRTLRVEVLNAMHARIEREEATSNWVTEALDDSRCAPDAVGKVVTERFGPKAVINDPSDTEGTKIAMSRGFTVIPGGAFSRGAWANIRAAATVLPAGQVTPSPKPYSPDGHPEKIIPRDQWTPDMTRQADFAEALFRKLTNDRCTVVIVNEATAGWDANFGKRDGGLRLCLNYGRLGARWFALAKSDVEVLDLLLHEFVHHTVHDHLSNEMHEKATNLGAHLVGIALREPGFFAG